MLDASQDYILSNSCGEIYMNLEEIFLDTFLMIKVGKISRTLGINYCSLKFKSRG
jgi:hypothetical protein